MIFFGLSLMLVLIVVLALVALLGMHANQSRLRDIAGDNVKKFDRIVEMQSAIQLAAIHIHHLVLDPKMDVDQLSDRIFSFHEKYNTRRDQLNEMELTELESSLLETQDKDAKLLQQ